MHMEKKNKSLFIEQSKEQKSIPGLVEVVKGSEVLIVPKTSISKASSSRSPLTSPCLEVVGSVISSQVLSLVLAIDCIGSLSDVENHQEFASIT